jgi:peptidoglycan hydrolase-like protein with peptidoglycan-binding domain
MMASTHFFAESFSEVSSLLLCEDGTKMVFQRYSTLYILVTSDQGESEAFLRTQINTLYHLLLMEYGPTRLYDRNSLANGYWNKQERRIRRLIDTMCHLCDTKQSFLVQAIEELLRNNSNSEVKNDINNYLLQALKRTPKATHALLFVGTQLLAQASAPKAFDLTTADVLLLIIYFYSRFQDNDVSSDTETLVEDDSSTVSNEEGYVSAEEGNEEEPEVNMEALHRMKEQVLSGVCVGTHGEIVEVIQRILKSRGFFKGEVDGVYSDIMQISVVEYQRSHRLPSIGMIDTDTLKILAKEQGSDANDKKTLSHVRMLQQVIELTFNDDSVKDGSESAPFSPAMLLFQSNLPGFMEKSNISLQETSPGSSVSPSPYSSSVSSQADNSYRTPQGASIKKRPLPAPQLSNDDTPQPPLWSHLFFRTPRHAPCWVCCFQLHKSITLVLICRNIPQPLEEDKEIMANAAEFVRRSLMVNYVDFVLSLENTHTIINYINQIPGLVHFILVDRAYNRVLAPVITPLTGANTNHSPEATNKMFEVLKNKVWDMTYQAQDFLSRGFTDMMVKKGHFVYCYKLWFEDNSDRILPIKESICVESKPIINREFYKKLQSRLLSNRQQHKFYELYSLFLGCLPTKIIEQQNQLLISVLLGRQTNNLLE